MKLGCNSIIVYRWAIRSGSSRLIGLQRMVISGVPGQAWPDLVN